MQVLEGIASVEVLSLLVILAIIPLDPLKKHILYENEPIDLAGLYSIRQLDDNSLYTRIHTKLLSSIDNIVSEHSSYSNLAYLTLVKSVV